MPGISSPFFGAVKSMRRRCTRGERRFGLSGPHTHGCADARALITPKATEFIGYSSNFSGQVQVDRNPAEIVQFVD